MIKKIKGYGGLLFLWILFMAFGVWFFYTKKITDPLHIFWYFGGVTSYLGLFIYLQLALLGSFKDIKDSRNKIHEIRLKELGI